jgi:hypothetical protein
MLAALFLPDPTVLQLEHTVIEEQRITLMIRTHPLGSAMPDLRSGHLANSL